MAEAAQLVIDTEGAAGLEADDESRRRPNMSDIVKEAEMLIKLVDEHGPECIMPITHGRTAVREAIECVRALLAALNDEKAGRALLAQATDKINDLEQQLAAKDAELAELQEEVGRCSTELGDADILITNGPRDGITKLINQRDALKAALEKIADYKSDRDEIYTVDTLIDIARAALEAGK